MKVGGQIQNKRRVNGKSKHAHRTVPVSADTAHALAAHLQNLAEEESLNGAGWNADGLLFVSENGTPLEHSNVWRTYTALLRWCGLTTSCSNCNGSGRTSKKTDAPPCSSCEGRGVVAAFRFHDLRHTYAALSLAAGVDLFTLSRRMGHSSITVTADRYGHLFAGKTDDADKLDSLIRRA